MNVFLRTKFNNFLIWQVTRYNFLSDISLRYAFGKNLMMWIKKLFQNQLAFYFHWQPDVYRIMRMVKEIRSDFNWSINLMNILMFTCSLIKSVFVILFVFFFPHCSVSAFATFQRIHTKKHHNIWYLFCNKYSAELVRDADIYLS